jgi:hypothetical protein
MKTVPFSAHDTTDNRIRPASSHHPDGRARHKPAPYGYRQSRGSGAKGTFIYEFPVIDPVAADVVRRIFQMYADGSSPKQIAASLNEQGVPGPRGSRWRDTAIRGHVGRGTGILNNPLYIGEVTASGHRDRLYVPDLRIVGDELWRQVKERQDAVFVQGQCAPSPTATTTEQDGKPLSNAIDPLDKTFKLFESEEEYQAVVAFVYENSDVFERLEDLFANAPAAIENGLHILAKPIFFTVDAMTISLAFKAPKRKWRFGRGHHTTFSVTSRQPGEKGLSAVGPSFAIGLFRMQQAVQAADAISALGFDARPGLESVLKEYAAQIQSLLYWLGR